MTATRASQAQERYRARLAGAMAVSLLVHGLILSLQFGIPGIGLPTLELPWRERRTQATRLEVVIANAEKPSADAQVELSAPRAPNEPQPLRPSAGLIVVPRREAPPPAAATKAVPGRAKKTPPAVIRRAKKEEPVIALTEPRERSFSVPAPALDEIPSALPEQPVAVAPPQPAPSPEPAMQDDVPAMVDDTAQREREAAEAARAQEEAAERQRASALEAQRIEERQQREEAERLAQELEARKREEEAARLALQKQREQDEAARRALELEEKRREETRRLQAERMQREAMELQAKKQAEELVARERERQAEELAARKAETEAANAARRDAELMPGDGPPTSNMRSADALPRNLGGGLASRALDQAKRPDLLRSDPPAVQRPEISTDSPRRHSVFGSIAKDVGVTMYVESWRLKIERNGGLNYKRSSAEKTGRDPVVTVAVRSDGSVEDVIIHQSSGRPEIDEAVHRIVRVNARFSAFPPELARRFDVIEIRRVWSFDDRLRILEEVR